MSDQPFLGSDLDLGFVADDEGRVFAGPYSQVDLQAVRREGVRPASRDLGLVRGRAAIAQALILRLMTERGELEPLGLPAYGSRHHRLVGEPNTEGNRNLLRLYILECLRQEPRIERVVAITARQGEGREHRDKVDVSVTLLIKGQPDPLSLVVPFSFGGALP